MYEFGYGLSYTTFTYADLQVNQDNLEAQVTITNTGERAGKETVLWFISDPEASITQPIKKLKYFEKIDLLPGESKTVFFSINRSNHLSYDLNGESIFEPGIFNILVGTQVGSFEVN